MINYVLYRKQIELLEIVKSKYVQRDFVSQTSSGYRDAVNTLFFDGNNLRDDFMEIIPVAHLPKSVSLLSFLRSAQCYSSTTELDPTITSSEQKLRNSQIIEGIDWLKGLIEEECTKRFSYGVFYSWQSDSPSKYNRNFIEDTLRKAIKGIKDLGIELRIDKDTAGIPGSPDIVNVITNKIENSICFVADVTPVTVLNGKCIPNPNVMLELGYALSSLGYERVIIVCNTAFCELKDLPFDLGLKRVVSYKYDENSSEDDKQAAREKLENLLNNHIRAVINP